MRTLTGIAAVSLAMIIHGVTLAQVCPTAGGASQGGSITGGDSSGGDTTADGGFGLLGSLTESGLSSTNESSRNASRPSGFFRVGGFFGPGFSAPRSARANQAPFGISMPASPPTGQVGGNGISSPQGLAKTSMSSERLQEIQQGHARRAYQLATAAESKGRLQLAREFYTRAAAVAPSSEIAGQANEALDRLRPRQPRD